MSCKTLILSCCSSCAGHHKQLNWSITLWLRQLIRHKKLYKTHTWRRLKKKKTQGQQQQIQVKYNFVYINADSTPRNTNTNGNSLQRESKRPTMPSPSSSHVVIFPFMAQGHTLPLLDLSKALSHRQINVTIITTPSNANSIAKTIANHPKISLVEIPFPIVDGLPKDCENTSQLPSMEFHLPFLLATKQLQKPFEEVLQTMLESKTPPICVISDFFLGWTLASCQALGVPRLVFHGMGVLSMAITKSTWFHAPQLESVSMFDPLDLPGMRLPFTLTRADRKSVV